MFSTNESPTWSRNASRCSPWNVTQIPQRCERLKNENCHLFLLQNIPLPTLQLVSTEHESPRHSILFPLVPARSCKIPYRSVIITVNILGKWRNDLINEYIGIWRNWIKFVDLELEMNAHQWLRHWWAPMVITY